MKTVGIWTTVVTALAATSSTVSPFATPIVETPVVGDYGAFHGVVDLAESLPRGSSVKVLWTHGMCTHPPSWVDDRIHRLAVAVGGTAETASQRPVGGHGATLRTERVTVSGRTFEVVFLTWSPLTAEYKAALNDDAAPTDGERASYTRATLNRELKRGLVNDCLTDVVVYGGPNGRDIRAAVRETVCEALGGRLYDRNCDVSVDAVPTAMALVTESLGSKLIFDAVLDMWNAAESSADRTQIDRLALSLATMRTMYMLANQVPLLESAVAQHFDGRFAQPAAPMRARTSARHVFGLLSVARTVSPPAEGPMTVVAFSDPNDLLSYRITPAHFPEDLKDFRIVNVIVSNDATYFGYVERPDTAHCGYSWNPHVYGMLAKGYQIGKAFPSAFGLAGGSCVGYMGNALSGHRG